MSDYYYREFLEQVLSSLSEINKIGAFKPSTKELIDEEHQLKESLRILNEEARTLRRKLEGVCEEIEGKLYGLKRVQEKLNPVPKEEDVL